MIYHYTKVAAELGTLFSDRTRIAQIARISPTGLARRLIRKIREDLIRRIWRATLG